MATQTFIIGDIIQSGADWQNWVQVNPTYGQIDAGLVESGDAFLNKVQLAYTSFPCRVETSLTDAGLSNSEENLTSAWESFESAIIYNAGALTVTLPGPTHSSNISNDSTDPYAFMPSVAKQTEIETFITGFGALSQAEKDATTVTLRDSLPDLMPTFGTSDIADQTYTQNAAIAALQLPSATGGDGTLAYSISGEPSGLSVNTSLQLVGTPTQIGTFNVTFTVTDADGDTDTIDFTITVNAPDLIPSLPAIADQTATVGTAFSLTFTAASGGDPPLTYSVSGEPSWMSLSGLTLSGTPDATGAHTITVTVTDDDGDTDTATFDLVVSAADVPQITIAADQASVVEGTNVTFTVTATIAPSANLNVHIVVTEMGDVIDVTPPASVQILSGATTATLTVTTAG